MPLYDIVYILKEKTDTDELKYSLRSVEANFPHRFVWFVGGQPRDLKPDRAVRHKQQGATKWDMIKSSMLRVIREEELTDRFFLFNDDFFVMKPFEGVFINYTDRDLGQRIEDFRKENAWLTPYARSLYKAEQELKSLGMTTYNFDVHMPMLFDKDKVGAIQKCSSPQMRSVYGNIVGCRHKDHKDVKVYSLTEAPPEDADFLSTNDNTFEHGRVGDHIRFTFRKPSRFEI